MKIISGLLCGLSAVGLIVSVAGTSEAFGVVSPCLTMTANATITVGPNGESSSPDASYASSACKNYVVDVKLASLPNGYSFSTDGGIANVPTGQLSCELAQDYVAYYRKAAGATDFVSAGGGYRRGTWTGNSFPVNTCQMRPVSTFQTRHTTAANGDTWRIVTRAVEAVESSRVKVTGGTIEIPR